MGAVILPPHHRAETTVSAERDWRSAKRVRFLDCSERRKDIAFADETPRNAVAKALARSPYVDEVIYPGLSTHPMRQVAYRSLSPQNEQAEDDTSFPYSDMISFRIKGGAEEANRLLTSTHLLTTLTESFGGVESLAEMPAQMTHGSIPAAERVALGITDNLIKLSVVLRRRTLFEM